MNSGGGKRKNAAELSAALPRAWIAGLALLVDELNLDPENLVGPAGQLADFIVSGQAVPPAGLVPSLGRELENIARKIYLPERFFPLLARTLFSAASILSGQLLGEDSRREADLLKLESEVIVEWHRAGLVSSRRKARDWQHKFVKERKRYLTLFRSINEAVFVIDPSRRIVDCNEAFSELVGLDRTSCLGRDCAEVVGLDICHSCPCLDREDPLHFFHNVETRWLDPQGVGRPAGEERAFLVSGAPFAFEDDSRGAIVVIEDVTEKRLAEAAVAKSERAFRTLVENLPTVTWRARGDGRYEYVSPNIKKILGLAPEQCLGCDRFARVHPDDHEWTREAFANLFSKGAPYDIRYRLMGADGDWIWVHDRASGVYEDEEGPLVDGVFWDISEFKNIEDELEEYRNWLEDLVDERTEDLLRANKQLKGEIRRRRRMEGELMDLAASLKRSNEELEHFAHVVSHDLKEPLILICAFGEKLSRGYDAVLDERGRGYLSRIIRAGWRLQRFIDGLLALARVTTREVDFVEVSLKPLVEEVVGDLDEMIAHCGGRVEVDVDQSLVGDRLQLYQLFQNILTNAIKYRREGVAPRIRIEAVALGNNFCEIRIIDNGIGFEEKDAARIFLPFERLHAKTADGAGIGLSTCERIVNRHGGEITARSIPGQGTTFIVRLPMSAD